MSHPSIPNITIFNTETEIEEAVSPAVPEPPSQITTPEPEDQPVVLEEKDDTVVVETVEVPATTNTSYETITTTTTSTTDFVATDSPPAPAATLAAVPPTPATPTTPTTPATPATPTAVSSRSGTSTPSRSYFPSQHDPLEPIPIAEFYRGRSVLLTGATGFVGKAVLWKLLSALGDDVAKIYVLIRNGSNKRKMGRPKDRLKNEILSNKAFTSLRRRLGTAYFDSLIIEKVVPVACDLIAPGLGISADDRAMLIANANIVIHCAATMDFNERLDLSLEINTLGTLRLMDLADECHQMDAFIHMSPIYLNANIPDGQVQERVYPMAVGEPEELLKEIVALELEDIPKMTQRVTMHYPNTYTFTKALTEHLILKRVDFNRMEEEQGGKKQWPIAIVRASLIGGSVKEPLVGWADGVTGAAGTLLFTGRGVQTFPPGQGDAPADVVPIDYLVRIIIGCAAYMKPPGTNFALPYADVPDPNSASTSIPATPGSISPRTSTGSEEYMNENPKKPKLPPFPVIYQTTAAAMKPPKWRHAYEVIREYWVRTTKVDIPTSEEYFVSSKAMFKARFFMKYQLPQSIASVAHAVVGGDGLGKNVQKMSKMVELASKISEASEPFLRHTWIFVDDSTQDLRAKLSCDPEFDLSVVDDVLWEKYYVDFNYGVHYYVSQEPGVRTISVPFGWDCALYTRSRAASNLIIDKQIQSIVYSNDDINRRSDRMVAQLVEALGNPGTQDKKKEDEWLTDMDASLDDWEHDDNELIKGEQLGKWRLKIGDNDEAVKVVVLNDKRVGAAIKQIVSNAGVAQQTAVMEATKILARMRERTQLAYVWFAGSFLKRMFTKLFASIRVREEDIARLKKQTAGKRVVYIPVSKTLLDPLLVWYVVIRYQLPVPAIVLDEGPISDILRLAGAYFIKREVTNRSPLNTAVTAAYTQVLLREHDALSFVLEKARTRTGKVQVPYQDGLVNMILEATLEVNQSASLLKSNGIGADDEPATPVTPMSPGGGGNKIVTKDAVFVPINITYERIPELSALTDEVLDQRPRVSTNRLSVPLVAPPSQAMVDRAKKVHNGTTGSELSDDGRFGRAFFGIGRLVSVQEVAEDEKLQKSIAFDTLKGQSRVVEKVTKAIQDGQRSAIIFSPVSLVAAIILYGRLFGGVQIGKIKDTLEWLRSEFKSKGVPIDWQEGEDLDAIIFYSFRLLDEPKNILIDSKEINDETNIRANDHADNIMALSYYANQLVDIFLSEALFSVVYLSYITKEESEQDVLDKFKFLVQLFEEEFVFPWDAEDKFQEVVDKFVAKDFLAVSIEDNAKKLSFKVDQTSDPVHYQQVCFYASLIYPTLDAYWITSCSLSALENVPFIPRKTVPVLTQWIATHLIAGRRTIYREVLSTEASRNAVNIFMALGFIRDVMGKEKLTPDAQALLHDLGIPTNETLVEMANHETTGPSPIPVDNENLMLKLMAQIEMNRATSNIADLCTQIDGYRFGAANPKENYQNAQVFSKCQKQIKSILRSDQSYAKKREVSLSREEDDMIQLVYSLKQSASTPLEGYKASRRVSEVYNLRPQFIPQ